MRDDWYGYRLKDQVTMRDALGRELFTVDAWIYDVALKRGDLARWFQ